MKKSFLSGVAIAAAVVAFEILLNASSLFTHGNIRLPPALTDEWPPRLSAASFSSASSSAARHLARTLAAQGNRVVLLDLLGHGRSDKPRHAGPHRMDLYAQQVLSLLDELAIDQAV